MKFEKHTCFEELFVKGFLCVEASILVRETIFLFFTNLHLTYNLTGQGDGILRKYLLFFPFLSSLLTMLIYLSYPHFIYNLIFEIYLLLSV